MNLPINWGDVPAWIEGLSGFGQLVTALRNGRRQRADDFSDIVLREARLTGYQIAEIVERQEGVGSLILEAYEAAVRTTAQNQRWLLAKVLVSAFRGDDAYIDETSLLLRTAAALEAPDVRVLGQFARPRPDNFVDVPLVGALTQEDLKNAVGQDQRPLIDPIVARLIREGLIVDEAVGTFDYQPAWHLTAYGYRFLQFLPELRLSELRQAAVVGVWRRDRPESAFLRNLGPGDATLVELSVKLGSTPTSIQHSTAVYVGDDQGPLEVGEHLSLSPTLPLVLPAGEKVTIAFKGVASSVLAAAETIDIAWEDGSPVLGVRSIVPSKA